jgi:hypothetical protein
MVESSTDTALPARRRKRGGRGRWAARVEWSTPCHPLTLYRGMEGVRPTCLSSKGIKTFLQVPLPIPF